MTGGGTERSRPFVIDGYSAPGGVGFALDDLSVRHLGIDIEDYGDTYPGEFVQDDCSDVESMASFETPDLFWLSPKCQAYSILPWANVSRYDWDETPKERYPTFEDPNVREVIGAVAPDHYIIENVATCDDLRDPCRPNGLAFGLPIENCRHFETSFPVPDAYERGTPEIALGHGYVRKELAFVSLVVAMAVGFAVVGTACLRVSVPPRSVGALLLALAVPWVVIFGAGAVYGSNFPAWLSLSTYGAVPVGLQATGYVLRKHVSVVERGTFTPDVTAD